MKGKKRKDYSSRKNKKAHGDTATVYYSKDKSNKPSKKDKPSNHDGKESSRTNGGKKFADRSGSRNSKPRGRSGGRFKKSDLDPSMMVNKTIKLDEEKRNIQSRRFEELDIKIKEMIEHNGPVIFDCQVDPNENCFPMIPSGKPHNQMILGPNDKEDNKITGKGKALV